MSETARALSQREYGDLLHQFIDAILDKDRDGAKAAITSLVYAHRAALNRIAELESPAHRARIAREFLEEAMSYENPCTSLYSAADDTLMRWEAAAKEGE